MTQTASSTIRNVIELARSRGSAAKTRDGARKYLLSQMGRRDVLTAGYKYKRTGRAGAYRAERRSERLRQHKAAVDGKATYLAQVRAFRGLPAAVQAALVPMYGGDVLAALQSRALQLPGDLVPITALDWHNHAQVGGWFVVRREDTERTEPYSRAYHRQYGPTIVTSNRRIEFSRLHRSKLEVKTVAFDGWRGDFVARALAESGLVQPDKTLMHLRLNPVYRVREVRAAAGFQVFERTLCGEFAVPCHVSPLGQTYHATSLTAAFAGLRSKRAAIERSRSGQVTLALARKLGFCDAGINSFAEAFSLDTRRSYTPDEVYQMVKQRPSAATPYLPELRRLAEALAFTVPELN